MKRRATDRSEAKFETIQLEEKGLGLGKTQERALNGSLYKFVWI